MKAPAKKKPGRPELPPEQRSIAEMKLWHGLTFEQIAETQGELALAAALLVEADQAGAVAGGEDGACEGAWIRLTKM